MERVESGRAGDEAVRLEGLCKSYGDFRAVDQLSLVVPKGSIYGFIGPNGSGKTTTIRMILHIFIPDTGYVEVLGERGVRAANDRVGYLPEERGLYKKMTVRQVLTYYGGLKGMGRVQIKEGIDRWLSQMGLEEWVDHRVDKLSKGMAQKIQFISAVLSGPELLILDEPFSGLDPVNREVLQSAMLEFRKGGGTIIFSTHDMRSAEELCDSIFMIYKGKKVLDGTLDAIQSEYGMGTMKVQVSGGLGVYQDWSGVKRVRNVGNYQEVEWEGNPQDFLKRLVEITEVIRFEVTRPSLQDIFLRIAGEH